MKGIADFDEHASYIFGLIGFLSSVIYALYAEFGATASSTEIPAFLLIITSTLVATIVGGVIYGTLVGHIPQLSIPTQGAVSGAIVIWVSITLMVPLVQAILNIDKIGLTPEVVSTLLWFMFISATFVSVFIGVFIIPVGAFAGYTLARRRVDS